MPLGYSSSIPKFRCSVFPNCLQKEINVISKSKELGIVNQSENGWHQEQTE